MPKDFIAKTKDIQMIFKNNSLNAILKKAKQKRKKTLYDQTDNVLFLDYDGVINIDFNNFG